MRDREHDLLIGLGDLTEDYLPQSAPFGKLAFARREGGA